jgi:hypothetical protein
MLTRLVKWFFFSILFGLLPLALAYSKAVSVGPAVTFKDIVARGGLLLLFYSGAIVLARGAPNYLIRRVQYIGYG